MSRQYEEENKAAIAKIWSSADNTEKARLWIKAFLYENFVLAKKDTVLVEVPVLSDKLERACRQMNIACETKNAKRHITGQRLVVVGRDELAVRSRLAELSKEEERAAARAKQEAAERRQAAAERRRAAEVKFQRKYKLEKKSKGRQSKEPWDVSGWWTIDCPKIQSQWGSDGRKCSLKIDFTKPTEDNRVQMFATFEFIAFQGIMRFVDSRGEDVEEDEDEDENGNDEYEDGDEDEESAPESESESFFFPSSSLPSSNNREFNYRWRGEETGMGEIMLGSDDNLCSVTFHSPNALSGTFSGAFGVSECQFIGLGKTGRSPEPGSSGCADPDHAWRSRNREAYEANRRRWR